jgi:hypothetical protein
MNIRIGCKEKEMKKIKTYTTLKQLQAAYKSGEISTDFPLQLDNGTYSLRH